MRHFIYNNKKYIAGGSAALALAVTACSLGTIGGGTRTLNPGPGRGHGSEQEGEGGNQDRCREP